MRGEVAAPGWIAGEAAHVARVAVGVFGPADFGNIGLIDDLDEVYDRLIHAVLEWYLVVLVHDLQDRLHETHDVVGALVGGVQSYIQDAAHGVVDFADREVERFVAFAWKHVGEAALEIVAKG